MLDNKPTCGGVFIEKKGVGIGIYKSETIEGREVGRLQTFLLENIDK